MNRRLFVCFLLPMILLSIAAILSYENSMRRTLGYWTIDLMFRGQNYNLMIGSSTIERMDSKLLGVCGDWLNRGIGNSDIGELINYLSHTRLNIRPQYVLIYAGENDLSRGARVVDTFALYKTLLSNLDAKYPLAQLHIVGIKPSPKRRDSWAKFRDLNRQLERYAVNHNTVYYHAPFYEPEIARLVEYFDADGVHLNKPGYSKFIQGITQECRSQ